MISLKSKLKKIVLFFLAFCGNIEATEYAPWFGNLFEFEFRTAYLYQHYSQIQSSENTFSHQGNNHFLDLSLAIVPWPDWDAEMEFIVANTSDTHFNFEQFKLTGRYLFFDNLLGDPFSADVGVSFFVLHPHFLHDFGVYEHGIVNLEAHFAIGKEIPECFIDTWAYRYWAMVGIAQGNRGSPWLHGHVQGEINWCDCFALGLYSDLLFGLGTKAIDSDEPFNGYAKIRHRSVDIGVFSRVFFQESGSFTVDYNFRPYALNFPEYAHTIKATLLFTFSI